MTTTRVDLRTGAPTRAEAAAPATVAWWRRLDPLGPALAVGAGAIYATNGFDSYLSRDLGLYAYAGQQVADGVAPYVGVYNRVGPLAHLVPGVGALAARLVGGDDLLGMRVLCLVLSAVSIWVAYLLGRDLFRSRVSGIATAAALLGINGFAFYATSGPREKTFLVLMLLAACWAMVRLRPGWAGFFVSLATLTWQPGLFFGGAAGVVALTALPRGTRLRGLRSFTLAGLAPLGFFLVVYAAIGHLRDFLECFVLINAQYTQQPGIEGDFGATRAMLQAAYGDTLWIIFVGAAALLVAAVVALASAQRRRDPMHRLVIALAAGLLVGMAWCLKALNGFPDIFFLLPATSVGIGYLAHVITTRLTRPVGLVAAVVWLAITAWATLSYCLDTRGDTLTTQRQEVAAAMAVLPDDASVVSIEAPQLLVLTGKTDPFQHQMFSLGLEDYVDDTWPGGLTGLANDIADRHPTVISVGTIDPTWLDPVLARDYVEVGTSPGWHWWVARSVGKERLDELRRVLA